MNTRIPAISRGVGVAVAALPLTAGTAFAKHPHKQRIEFDMTVSAGAAVCLPHARADVRVVDDGTATVTPFNGEHNAGIQVLNTANFAEGAGPLRQLK